MGAVGTVRWSIVVGQSSATSSVLIWIGVLMVVVAIGGVLALRLRKRILGDDQSEGLHLDDIRRLRDRGEISQAEYERLRDQIVGQVRGADAEPVPPARPSSPPDPAREAGTALEAPPGFDLTGEPLPPRPDDAAPKD